MMKYILKESELRAMIENIVTEEVNNVLNEGIGAALGNTLKNGALGIVAPAMLAKKAFSKANGIVNGNDTLLGTVKDYFGAGGNSGGSGRKTRAQKQTERLSSSRSVGYEYGKPEVVPSWGSRLKLDKKREITAPERSQLQWGSFGSHYHDEGDRMWSRMLLDKENTVIRLSGGDQNKAMRLQKKYKKILIGWLKDRDKAYEVYIKSNNRI